MTFPHTLQERKGPFACPRCGSPDGIFWCEVRDGTTTLLHRRSRLDERAVQVCTWLDEATDEQVEALK